VSSYEVSDFLVSGSLDNCCDFTFSGDMSLNRAGDFLLRLEVTDRVTNQSIALETPMHVESP
jgi:hypothetical protein